LRSRKKRAEAMIVDDGMSCSTAAFLSVSRMPAVGLKVVAEVSVEGHGRIIVRGEARIVLGTAEGYGEVVAQSSSCRSVGCVH